MYKYILQSMLTEKIGIVENKNIGTKVAFNDYKKIMKLVESGFFINSSDFLREAIRDKLREYDIIEIRDLPHDEAKKEIIEFCQKKQTFDISIIADELKLDIFFVNNIVEELIEEGIIEEDE